MVDRYSDDDDDKHYEKIGYTFTSAKEHANSTPPASFPISVEFDSSKKAQSELEMALKEIAELKMQLTSISAERNAWVMVLWIVLECYLAYCRSRQLHKEKPYILSTTGTVWK